MFVPVDPTSLARPARTTMCCMAVIVYCYAIHFTIFLCSLLNISYVPDSFTYFLPCRLSPWEAPGERLECGRQKPGVSPLLLALGNIFNSMVESPPWFQLLLAAPSRMVLALAWQPPSEHSLLVLHIKFPPGNYLASWSHGEATWKETSPSCQSSLQSCQTQVCRSPLE